MKNYNKIIKRLMLQKVLNEHKLNSFLNEYRGGGGDSWTQQVSSSMGELGPLFDIFSDFAKQFIQTGLQAIVDVVSIPAMGVAGLAYGKKGQQWWVQKIQGKLTKAIQESEWLKGSGALEESMKTIAAIPLFVSNPILYFLVLDASGERERGILNDFFDSYKEKYLDAGTEEKEEKAGIFDIEGQRQLKRSRRERIAQREEQEEEEKIEKESEEDIERRGIIQQLLKKEMKGVEELIKDTIQSGFIGIETLEQDIKKSLEKVKITKTELVALCDKIIKNKDRILRDWEILIHNYEKNPNKLAMYSEIFKELKTNSKKMVDTTTASHGKNIIGDIDFSRNTLEVSISERGSYTDAEKEEYFEELLNGLKRNADKFIKQQDAFYNNIGNNTEDEFVKNSILNRLDVAFPSLQSMAAGKIDGRSAIMRQVKKEFYEAKEFVQSNSLKDIAAKYGIKY